jgi:hypothetical protein
MGVQPTAGRLSNPFAEERIGKDQLSRIIHFDREESLKIRRRYRDHSGPNQSFIRVVAIRSDALRLPLECCGYDFLPFFHGDNTGSNLFRDANRINDVAPAGSM